MFAAALLFVGAQGAAGPTAGAIEQPDPKAMSYAQIKAFNAKVPRGHPYYIRCVKSAAVGSLVARNVSCRTNEQWKKAEELANDEARDVMEHTKGKMMSGN